MLHFINALFCETLGPDYEPLQPHRPQVGPTPAVEFLWAREATEQDTDIAAPPQPVVEGDSPIFAATTLPRGARHKNRDSPQPASPGSENDDTMTAAERLRRREAHWIARRIRAMLDAGEQIVWDDKAAASGLPAVRGSGRATLPCCSAH